MRIACLLAALLILTGLTGCANGAGNAAPRTDDWNENDGNVGQVEPYAQPGVQPEPSDDASVFDEETAERLEKLAESIQGVREATCVVLGKVAIIGIDVEGTLDRGSVGSVKYAVAEALAKDPAGVKTAVTADLDIRNRIDGIRDRVGEGHPIRGLTEQFAELIGRVMPQFPRNTAPKAEPQGHPDDIRQLQQQGGPDGQQGKHGQNEQRGQRDTLPQQQTGQNGQHGK